MVKVAPAVSSKDADAPAALLPQETFEPNEAPNSIATDAPAERGPLARLPTYMMLRRKSSLYGTLDLDWSVDGWSVHRSVVFYFMLILFVGVGAIALMAPNLMLPMYGNEEGVWGNPFYFLMYNGSVVTLFSFLNWLRLFDVCTIKNEDTGMFVSVAYRFSENKARWILAGIITWVEASVLMIVISLLWTGELSGNENTLYKSYTMLYGAPMICTVGDFMFVALLVPSKHKKKTLGVTLAMDLLTATAILAGFISVLFMLFGSKVVDSGTAAAGVWNACCVLANVSLREGYVVIANKAVQKAATYFGFDSNVKLSSGLKLYYDVMFGITQAMLLFPGRANWVTLSSTLVLDIIVNVWRTKQFHEAYNKFKNETDNNDNRAMMPTKILILAQYRVCRHLSSIVCPLIALAAQTVVINYRNQHNYFIFDCLPKYSENSPLIQETITMLLVQSAACVVMCIAELGVLSKTPQLLKAVVVAGAEYVFGKKYFLRSLLTLSFAAVLFTSCFFVKFDGLYVLDSFSSCVDK